MKRANTHAPRTRPGYTLVELLVASAASSLLLVGLASAIGITARAVSPPTDQLSVLKTARVTGLMADELQSAIYIRDHSSTSVDFVLNDRDGSGDVEQLGYSWDAPGETLSRHHGAAIGNLLDAVSTFQVEPHIRSVAEQLGGQLVSSSESSVSYLTSASYWWLWYLTPWDSIGQHVVMSHPDGTLSWTATKVRVALRRDSSYISGEQIIVQVREATGDGLPTGVVLAEGSISVSSLSSSYFAWKTITLSGGERIPPTQEVCIVVSGDDQLGGTAGQVLYATSGYSNAGSLLKESSGSWAKDTDDGLFYVLRGIRHSVDDSEREVTRDYVVGYSLSMNYDGGTSVQRRVRLLNTPEHLSGLWKLDFDGDPTQGVDANFDSAGDWQYTGSGSFAAVTSGSVLSLTAGQQFQTTVDNDFAKLITVDVHCRGTAHDSSGGGAFLEIPFGSDAVPSGLITVSAEKSASGAQVARVVAAAANGTEQVLALVAELPDAIVEFRLVIDPIANEVAVWVNDVAQGRSVVTRPRATALKRMTFGAVTTSAQFDFLSVRVGGE